MIPNHDKSLPARIRELELQRSSAVFDKDWTKASEIAERVAELKAELHQAIKPNIRRMTEDEIAAGEMRMWNRHPRFRGGA